MSHSVIVTAMVVLGVVSIGLLAQTLHAARRADHLDGGTALTLGMGWLYTLPIAAVAYSGSLRRVPDLYGALTPVYPGWYAHASQLGILLVGGLASALVLRRLRHGRVEINASALVAVMLWAVAQLAGRRTGGPWTSGRGVVLLLCLLAAVVLPRGRGALLGAAVFGVTVAIASGLLATVRYDVAFVVPCVDACGGLGFNGVVPNPDLLGDVLAASVPCCYLGFTGRARYWFTCYVAVMALATGSVTASATALLTVGLLVALRPRLDAGRVSRAGSVIAGAALGGTAVVSAFVVTHAWSPYSLSGRPAIWQVAITHIEASPWWGYGPSAWAGLYQLSQIPYADLRSTHNQWLDVLFTAGVVGAALLVVLVVVLIWSAGRARPAALVALTCIATLGIAEPVWVIGSFDVLSFSFVALLLLGPAAAETRPSGTSSHLLEVPEARPSTA